MKLKFGLLLTAIIVLVTTCFLVWPTLFRYSSLKINSQTILVRINRISGYTQHLYPSGWINIDAHLTSVSQSDINKIEIILNVINHTTGSLKATIYNGSNWIINNITYKIEYRVEYEILKNVKISRKYKIDGLYIPPLNLVSVPLHVIDADKLSSTSFVPVRDNNGNLKPYNKNIWNEKWDKRKDRSLSQQEVFEFFTGYEVVEIAKPNYSIIPLEAKGYKIR